MKSRIVAISMILSLTCLHAQQAPKKAQTPTGGSESEARRHYKIAVAALQNNDLETAEDELNQTARLSPRNALVFYNLAVVESKRGDIRAADANLTKAEHLGIPASQQDPASTLRGELDYKLKQQGVEDKKKAEGSHRAIEALKYFEGTWFSRFSQDTNLWVLDEDCIENTHGQVDVSFNSDAIAKLSSDPARIEGFETKDTYIALSHGTRRVCPGEWPVEWANWGKVVIDCTAFPQCTWHWNRGPCKAKHDSRDDSTTQRERDCSRDHTSTVGDLACAINLDSDVTPTAFTLHCPGSNDPVFRGEFVFQKASSE